MLAIPFAVQSTDGRMVDVTEVEPGLGCNCECPSCGMPLLARQGGERDWHFAHDAPVVSSPPTHECEHSVVVSVRRMSQAILADIRTIGVPHAIGQSDTQYRSLTFDSILLDAEFEGTRVDALASIRGYPLVLYMTYPGRSVPEALFQPINKEAGILELHLPSIVHFIQDAAVRASFPADQEWMTRGHLEQLITRATLFKRWIFHPCQTDFEPVDRPVMAQYGCSNCSGSWVAGFSDPAANTCHRCSTDKRVTRTALPA